MCWFNSQQGQEFLSLHHRILTRSEAHPASYTGKRVVVVVVVVMTYAQMWVLLLNSVCKQMCSTCYIVFTELSFSATVCTSLHSVITQKTTTFCRDLKLNCCGLRTL
jgi:hypothetical protein